MENKTFTQEQRIEILEKTVQNLIEFIMEFEEYNEIVERQMMKQIKEKDPELYQILKGKVGKIPTV